LLLVNVRSGEGGGGTVAITDLGVVNGGGVRLGCVRALPPRDDIVPDQEAPAQPSWSTVEVQVVAQPHDTHPSRRRARPGVRASIARLGSSAGKRIQGLRRDNAGHAPFTAMLAATRRAFIAAQPISCQAVQRSLMSGTGGKAEVRGLRLKRR